jgi:hypothetical protein
MNSMLGLLQRRLRLFRSRQRSRRGFGRTDFSVRRGDLVEREASVPASLKTMLFPTLARLRDGRAFTDVIVNELARHGLIEDHRPYAMQREDAILVNLCLFRIGQYRS